MDGRPKDLYGSYGKKRRGGAREREEGEEGKGERRGGEEERG